MNVDTTSSEGGDDFDPELRTLARRYAEKTIDIPTALVCSGPRRDVYPISSNEIEQLAEYGLQIYGDVWEHYWCGRNTGEGIPYVEESLDIMPDGSVRYTATFLPSRFDPADFELEDAE